MTKYVNRIMDEVYDNFRNHFDNDEKIWFLEELIEEFQEVENGIKAFLHHQYTAMINCRCASLTHTSVLLDEGRMSHAPATTKIASRFNRLLQTKFIYLLQD